MYSYGRSAAGEKIKVFVQKASRSKFRSKKDRGLFTKRVNKQKLTKTNERKHSRYRPNI